MVEFNTWVTDNPWQFGDKLPKGRGAERKYKCMPTGQLMRLQLPPLAQDCRLFMWRVAAMQQDALDVLRFWGFELKSELVWYKLTSNGKPWFGMGRQTRAAHEVCLIATRGRPERLSKSVRSVFEAPVPSEMVLGKNGKMRRSYIHSAKPDRFYEIVDELSPGPTVEWFARRQWGDWKCVGDQMPGATDADRIV